MKKSEIMNALFELPSKVMSNDLILEIAKRLVEDEDYKAEDEYDHDDNDVIKALKIKPEHESELIKFLNHCASQGDSFSKTIEKVILVNNRDWNKILCYKGLSEIRSPAGGSEDGVSGIEDLLKGLSAGTIEMKAIRMGSDQVSDLSDMPLELKKMLLEMLLRKLKKDSDDR